MENKDLIIGAVGDYTFDHTDNCPSQDDPRYHDFIEGRKFFYNEAYNQRHVGYSNLAYDHSTFDMDGIANGIWIKSSNYKLINI